MSIKNKDVAKSFINKQPNESLHLKSTGEKLFSYTTCIAQWSNKEYNKLYVNYTKYSNTTSRHLSLLHNAIQEAAKQGQIFYFSPLENIDINSQNLYKNGMVN